MAEDPNTGIEWWQVIAAASSGVAAFMAVITAWLNYRSRPLAVKAFDKHCEQLRSKLEEWKDTLQGPYDLFSYEGTNNEDRNILVDPIDTISNPRLFNDLIENHLPNDSELISLWNQYKSEWNDFENERLSLYLGVMNLIKAQTGLEISNSINDNDIVHMKFVHECNHGILNTVQGVFPDLNKMKIDLEGYQPTYNSAYGGTWMIDHYACITDKAMALEIHGNLITLVDKLPEAVHAERNVTLLTIAQNTVDLHSKLNNAYQQIVDEVSRLLDFPLFPNAHCPMMEQIKEPFLPRWIRGPVQWCRNKLCVRKKNKMGNS